MNFDLIVNLFEKHGLGGLLAVFLIYVFCKGQFSFKYPRESRRK
jgi:hypothetical protein